ncbi:NAD-dependent epimerase/dehydratase family protein [Zobellia nedashkovskayae]
MRKTIQGGRVSSVIHLAAQAGVRHSIENPNAFIQSNVVGFLNILECSRNQKIEHLIYASSSSVNGDRSKVPFFEKEQVDTPASFYAATKKSNELMAHSYSHLCDLRTTALRFFTVYGPWGRARYGCYAFCLCNK